MNQARNIYNINKIVKLLTQLYGIIDKICHKKLLTKTQGKNIIKM